MRHQVLQKEKRPLVPFQYFILKNAVKERWNGKGKNWALKKSPEKQTTKTMPQGVQLLAFPVELGHSLVYLYERSGLSR